MKKKVVSLCLVALLAMGALIGGTMAYFTDKDSADNVFTAGGVKIDLIEQEVGENGLQDFTPNQVLMPIVGSAQGEKNVYGQPIAANYIDKIVTIKNTGKSAAYVRAYFAIPSDLDDGEDTFNAGLNILHFNFGNKIVDSKVITTYGNEWKWKTQDGNWNYFETTIDDVAYNVYYADYYQPLAANGTTEQFISGIYLDSNVDMDDNGNYTDKRNSDADLSILNGEVKCPVVAVAVQADGFDSVSEAVDAAFGADFNPWAN